MTRRPILRRCVSCRKILDRQHFFRVTRDFQNGVVLESGMGRSAYLCQTQKCVEEAWKRKRLQKALRCQVELSVFNLLHKRLNTCNDSDSEA